MSTTNTTTAALIQQLIGDVTTLTTNETALGNALTTLGNNITKFIADVQAALVGQPSAAQLQQAQQAVSGLEATSAALTQLGQTITTQATTVQTADSNLPPTAPSNPGS